MIPVLKQSCGVPSKINAATILLENARNTTIPPILREYFRAVVREELPSHFLSVFKIFASYSDDLPSRLVGQWHPAYPNMKCRVRVILGIRLNLQECLHHSLIHDAEIEFKIRKYLHHDWASQKGAWTTPAEMNIINDTLHAVINYLQREYKLD